MDYIAELEKIAVEFESENGPLPRVTRLADLDAYHSIWLETAGKGKVEPNHFAVHLGRSGYAPCRMSDGSLAFMRMRLKTPQEQV